MTSFHQQGCHPLIGSAKARRHVFTSFCFSKLNFKIQSSLRSILMWCDFSLPYWRKGWVYFIWDGRLEERSGTGGYGTVHLTFTHIHNTWYMASQRILLNLYCSWGQALNSPLKEHNGSSDRAHGISVYRAGLRLFHPVQDVTSCMHFFSCRNAAGQSYLRPCDWLMNLLDGNRQNRLLHLALHQSETVQDP